MRPPIPITDARFQYRDSVHTNVAETFAKERARLAEQAAQKQQTAQVESLLTRRIHNIFDARRREAEQAAIRG